MQDKFILKMYDDGVTLDKISLAFKKSVSEIIEIVYSLKVKG